MSAAGWSFGAMLEQLKVGRRVAREGWNGKGMFLVLVRPVERGEGSVRCAVYGAPGVLTPWIGMKTADGGFVPWLASQTDVLAEDWWVISEEKR